MTYIYGKDVYDTLVAYKTEFIGTFVMISREGRKSKSFGKIAEIKEKLSGSVEVWFYSDDGHQDGCYVDRYDSKAYMKISDPKEQEELEARRIFSKLKSTE